MNNDSDNKNIAIEAGKRYLGPIVYSYVKWVLNEAKKRGIETLYFLARDGFLLHLCAQRLLKEDDTFPIKIQYLYCSRVSFRMASYHILPISEIMDSVFIRGYSVTLDKIFDRVLLSEEEKERICREENLNNRYEVLSNEELEKCEQILSQCQLFLSYVKKNAAPAYENAMRYLEQEGLLSGRKFAVVDSGWVGSMQKSLLLLLKSKGFSGKITGFYFGMFQQAQNTPESEYVSYYFGGRHKIIRKACFNNNLFEILCSASNGMTIGYYEHNGRMEPELAPYNRNSPFREQIQQSVLLCKEYDFSVMQVRKRIFQLMTRPEKRLAEMLGDIRFSDDLSDKDMSVIAPPLEGKQYQSFNICYRWKNRNKKYAMPELRIFWPQGSIMRSHVPFRAWYIFMITIWNFAKYLRDDFKT